MSYFNKKEVKDFLEKSNLEITEKNLSSIDPFERAVSQLENENEMVNFFWMAPDLTSEKFDLKICGDSFYRIGPDLYTNDRFAKDLYAAQLKGVDVTTLIKENELKKKESNKVVIDLNGGKDFLEEIEKAFKNKKVK